MTATDFVASIKAALEPRRNPEQAAPMAAYMKNLFPFLGLPTTERVALTKPLLKSAKPHINSTFLHRSARLLWALEEREYQYTAIDLLLLYAGSLETTSTQEIEHLVIHKSWWDSIDPLASVVGKAIPRFPEWLPIMDQWSLHSNFWLRRMAILYQRSFKGQTDAERLFGYCLESASHKEFW
jgi:3-methyladenine DNA glycosylase AlkD